MTDGPSILRGLVWTQRSCMDPSAIRSSCSGLTPTSRNRVGNPVAETEADHLCRVGNRSAAESDDQVCARFARRIRRGDDIGPGRMGADLGTDAGEAVAKHLA